MVAMPDYGFANIAVDPDLGITSARALGGLIITSRNADPYWTGRLTTGLLEVIGFPNQHADFRAFLSWCIDTNQRVDFLHPRHRYPDNFNDGNWPLGADPTVAAFTNLRSMTVAGLQVGMVLPRGTRVSFIQGTGDSAIIAHRWLQAGVTVSSATVQAVQVTPRLPLGIFEAGCKFVLKDPPMRIAIVPGSWDTAEVPEASAISFDVAEALR